MFTFKESVMECLAQYILLSLSLSLESGPSLTAKWYAVVMHLSIRTELLNSS